MAQAWTLSELGYLCIMWSIMMSAMMLPSALPTILMVSGLSYNRRSRQPADASGLGITPIFVTGYLTVWTTYSVLAATVQWILHGTLLVPDAMASASPILSGGLLLAAGRSPLRTQTRTAGTGPGHSGFRPAITTAWALNPAAVFRVDSLGLAAK